MKLIHPIFYFVFAVFAYQSVHAQTVLITYKNPDALSVCNADTFFITVRNLSAQTANNGNLTINLPNGLVYTPGSVFGATEINTGNLQAPVFSFPAIPPGSLQFIKILLNADCAAANVLDTGALFIANLSVLTSAGNAQVQTISIPVETGLVLIESVDPQFSSGERFDTILRKICIINTRLGPISKLFFEDVHLPGIEILVNGAQNVTQTNLSFRSEFSGSFFSAFGDGDQLLELGEKVCFTEEVAIKHCGIPSFYNQSILRVGWGCDATFCRYDSILTGIEIKESTRVPNLKMTPFWQAPADYCATLPASAGFSINNLGGGNAQNVLVRLKVQEKDWAGIDPNSLRISTVNGPSIPIAASVVTNQTIGSCNAVYGSDITLVIPMVPAKDSLIFQFDYYNCSQECDEILPTFLVDYYYQKPCPVNGFVSDGLVILPDLAYKLRQDVKLSVNTCFQDGETYPFQYKIETKRLKEANGLLKLTFELPNGLTWSNDCPNVLGGVSPVNITTIPDPVNHLTKFSLSYPLPLNLTADVAFMQFCLKYQCDTTTKCVGDTSFSSSGGSVYYFDPQGLCSGLCLASFPVQTNWLPNANAATACGASTCDELFLSLSRTSCTDDDGSPNSFDTTVVYDTPVVKYTYKFDAYRLNYDLPDNDNNRIADGPGIADHPNVARRRYLAGDTLRAEFSIFIDSGQGMKNFPRSIVNMITKSDIPLNDNDSFNIQTGQNIFSDATKFRFLSDTVRIRYADGSTYKVPYKGAFNNFDKRYIVLQQVNAYPPVVLDEVTYISNISDVRLDSLFKRGLLPKATIGKGDSLFVYSDFQLDFNYIPNSDNNPNPPLVGFRTRGDDLGLGYAPVSTATDVTAQYSGFKTGWTNSAYSLKPCQNSAQVKPFSYRLRIARGNMFPFEVRPLARIVDYYQTMPAQASVVNAQLKYLALQDSVNILSNTALPFTQGAGIFDLNFDNVFASPVDEGFSLETDVTFGPDCQFSKPDSSKQYLTVALKPGMYHPDTLKEKKFNTLGYFSNLPRLQIQSNDTIVYVTQKSFDLDFLIRNAVASPAPNLWISVVSPSGNATNFQLYQLPQLQSITKQNAIFQLNTLNGFSGSNLRLTGLSNSCVSDSLLIIYGWNCSSVTNINPEICGIDSFWIVLRKESPEIELDIKSEPASIQICEVSDYYEVEVYNAKTGYAYDLDVSVSLPPGLQIVPGSCQISYPLGSPYTALSDPDINNGLYHWDINAVQAAIALNGLPGVDQVSKNAFRIRFKTLASCGFVANAQPIFGVNGVDPCGSATNSLNKPASPLSVNGLNPSYGVIMELSPVGSPMLFCGGTQQYKVRSTLLGTPSNTDSIYVLLPGALQYVGGSYTPGQNAPISAPSLSAEGFRVAIPSNLGNGSVIEFTFSVDFKTGAGCGSDLIIAQSRVSTAAFCATLGTNCTVYFATGEAILPVNIEHPQLLITDASIQNIDNAFVVKVAVRNIGLAPSQGVQLQLWNDLNGDGMLGVGDVLITNAALNAILNPNGFLIVSLPAQSTLPDLCNLIILLPADQNCLCSDQIFPLKNLLIDYQASEICEIKAVQVGIPAQNGYQYEWTIPEGSVQCASCASTVYTPPATATPGYTQSLRLLATNATCSVIYQFTYKFGFPFTLKPNNQTLCEGKPLVLTVTPAGAQYAWTGPGIQNNNSAFQTLTVFQSGTYSVTVTLNNGCTADTSMFIQVLPSDTVQLPALLTCAGVPVNILGQTTAIGGQYKLLKQKVNGCDSLILQQLLVKPNVNTESSRSFCKGDTLLQYNQVFINNGGQACSTVQGVNGCDSTHCVNVIAYDPPMIQSPDTIYGQILQKINLNAVDGFTQYIWSPSIPNCINCSDAILQFDSAGFYEYTLIVGDGNQCVDTVVYRIVVFPLCDPVNVRIPNAFTPNQDGLNDTFKVVDREGAEVVGSITIYDRWGEKVYTSNTQLFWNGTIDGQPAPNDVYVYIIEIICGDSPEKLVGDVTLLR